MPKRGSIPLRGPTTYEDRRTAGLRDHEARYVQHVMQNIRRLGLTSVEITEDGTLEFAGDDFKPWPDPKRGPAPEKPKKNEGGAGRKKATQKKASRKSGRKRTSKTGG